MLTPSIVPPSLPLLSLALSPLLSLTAHPHWAVVTAPSAAAARAPRLPRPREPVTPAPSMHTCANAPLQAPGHALPPAPAHPGQHARTAPLHSNPEHRAPQRTTPGGAAVRQPRPKHSSVRSQRGPELMHQVAGGTGHKDKYVHASRRAPRCLPCNYTDPVEATGVGARINSFHAVKACPCTMDALCKGADNPGIINSWDCTFTKYRCVRGCPPVCMSVKGGWAYVRLRRACARAPSFACMAAGLEAMSPLMCMVFTCPAVPQAARVLQPGLCWSPHQTLIPSAALQAGLVDVWAWR